MAKAIILQDEIIISKIYNIRGLKVMMDKDLAEMYGVETKQLKRQVKRNIDRFPEEFMLELTSNEFENMRSQNGTTSWGGSRYLPFAFTEHGVLMLSSVLNSPTAIQVNIKIIKVFTKLREIFIDNKDVLLKLEKLDKKIMNIGFDVKMHDGEIESIFSLIDEWRKEREEERAKEKARLAAPKNPIGFKTKSSKK
ncbi:MAG TPA: ORF6N domain-containing protein [Chitinophagaceae bacterium]|nr:ORF6N domain-containing protein [Chitinophagaceae bacterium]